MANVRRKIESFVFGDTFEPIVEKETVAAEQAGEFREGCQVRISTCAHGHAIRAINEIVGRCVIGNELICIKCAELRCAFHNTLLCSNHAAECNGYVVCPNHRFLELLRRTWRRPEELPQPRRKS